MKKLKENFLIVLAYLAFLLVFLVLLDVLITGGQVLNYALTRMGMPEIYRMCILGTLCALYFFGEIVWPIIEERKKRALARNEERKIAKL